MKYKFDEFVSNLENQRWNKKELAFLKEISTYCFNNPTVSRLRIIKWSVEQGYIKRSIKSIETKVCKEIMLLRQDTSWKKSLLENLKNPDFPIYTEESTLEALNKTMR